MTHSCSQCGQSFTITSDDLAFYDKISPVFAGKKYAVPPPKMCPDCRRRNRLIYRNFFHLYHRNCDLTGKKIISMYDADCTSPVYDLHTWWSDAWDPLAYGFRFDNTKDFFAQLALLHRSVPRMAIQNSQCENTDYCNLSFQSKNCYLVFGNVDNEDCYYGHIVWQSRNCFDCLYTYRSEFCYECTDCVQCHTLFFSRDCNYCTSSSFLTHCTSCSDCFGCVGLHKKQYCIFNEQHTKETYSIKMRELDLGNYHILQIAKEKTDQLIRQEIVKYYHGFQCENVTGDYLYNSRNIVEGYDLKNCEDCKYCATLESFTDSQDCNFSPSKSELCYECIAVTGYMLLACHNCTNACVNLRYCDNCYACSDCFGCVGLRNKKYCILNIQYTPDEYEILLETIIKHMIHTKEWGKFFPQSFSPFAYNETIANQYFPLSKEAALQSGLRWKEEASSPKQYIGPHYSLPNNIKDANSSITNNILQCDVSGRLYKILPQELSFLRSMNLPLPRLCFEERQKKRFALRNPRKLWSRTCMKCSKSLETTYSPDRPEIVYCEECYLKEVY